MMSAQLPVLGSSRECGECSVCCVAVSIEELEKPARKKCYNLASCGYGCTIHGSADRPPVCGQFKCSWLRGMGTEDDRPDLIGAMISVNDMNGGKFVFVLETAPGAVMSAAAEMVSIAARVTRLPVIISDYEAKPPDDTGDRVAVHSSIRGRANRIAGTLLSILAPDVTLHQLVKV